MNSGSFFCRVSRWGQGNYWQARFRLSLSNLLGEGWGSVLPQENAFRLHFHFRMIVTWGERGSGGGGVLKNPLQFTNVEAKMVITAIHFRACLSLLSTKLRGWGSRDDHALRWQMEVSYLVGIIKKKKNLQILPFAQVPFRASLQVSVSWLTRYKNACFGTATAPKICSRSYFVKEPLSVNIENQAPDKKIRSFFLFHKKTLLVLKLFSSLDRPKRGRRPKGNYAN